MKKALTLFLVLFLSGCSSQFVYNNLDFVVDWYIHDYIELNKTQEAIFDDAFTELWQWHRQEELVKYHQHLLVVKTEIVNQQLTAEKLMQHFEKSSTHWQRLRARVTPELVKIAVSMDKKQVDKFFSKLEKDNNQRDSEDASDDSERLEKRTKQLRNNVKRWVGRLTKKQKSIIDTYAPLYRSDSQLWREYRRTSQAEAKAVFALEDRGALFQQQLTDIIRNPEQFKSQQLIEASAFNRPQYAQMMIDILATLSDKQKTKLRKRIDDILEDLEDLINKKS